MRKVPSESSLLGVDAGRSTERKSSAVCCLAWDEHRADWHICRFRAHEEEREQTIRWTAGDRPLLAVAITESRRSGVVCVEVVGWTSLETGKLPCRQPQAAKISTAASGGGATGYRAMSQVACWHRRTPPRCNVSENQRCPAYLPKTRRAASRRTKPLFYSAGDPTYWTSEMSELCGWDASGPNNRGTRSDLRLGLIAVRVADAYP